MKIINQILDTIFKYQLQDRFLMKKLVIFWLFLVSYQLQNPIKNRQGFITVRDPVNPDKALRQE